VQVVVSIVLVSAPDDVRTLQRALSAIRLRAGWRRRAAFDVAMHGYDQEAGRSSSEVLDAVRSFRDRSRGPLELDPFSIDQSFSDLRRGEVVPPISDAPSAVLYQATTGFFRAMGTRLIAGRDLEERDGADSPRVAIVNQALVQKLIPSGEPLGRRFRFNPTGAPFEIVGIVEAGKYQTVAEQDQLAVWIPSPRTAAPRLSWPATGFRRTRRSRSSGDRSGARLRADGVRAKPLAGYLDLPTTPLGSPHRRSRRWVLCGGPERARTHAWWRSRPRGEPGRSAFGWRWSELGDVIALLAHRSHRERERRSGSRSLVRGTRFLASLLYATPEDASLVRSLMVIVSAVAAWAPARRALDVEPRGAPVQ
jgi:hypothetical protein